MNYNIVDGSFSNVYILTVVMMEDDICSVVEILFPALMWPYVLESGVTIMMFVWPAALPSSPAHAAPNQIFHSDHSV